MPVFREFAKLIDGVARLPDETTILRFRHLLEKHNLATDMLRVSTTCCRSRASCRRRCNAHRGTRFDQECGRRT